MELVLQTSSLDIPAASLVTCCRPESNDCIHFTAARGSTLYYRKMHHVLSEAHLCGGQLVWFSVLSLGLSALTR